MSAYAMQKNSISCLASRIEIFAPVVGSSK